LCGSALQGAEVGKDLDGSEHILHHTVSGGEGNRSRQRDKGITWPARHLARDIGARGPGSQGERAAARFIDKELKALGLPVEDQVFKTPATTAWSEMLVHLITLIGVLIFPLNSHISYGLVCLGFFLFLLESYGRSPLAWLQIHRRSENVIARINSLRPSKRTLVLIAHMDSPRAAFYHHRGLDRLIGSAILLDFLCMAAIFMILTMSYAGYLLSMEEETLSFFWYMGLIASIPPSLALIALLIKAAGGSATPGGNDNASGVAVLLELARVYTRRQPHSTDLWLVSTGSSDAGGAGVRKLIKKYRRELKGVNFILIEGVGRGFPVCYKREGRLISFRANRKLTGLARRISDEHAHYSAGLRRNNLYLGDGFQLLSRGRKAITVSSREESRYPRFWRSSKDDYDNIDPRSLRLSLDFMTAMVDNIDHGDIK